MTLTTGTSVKMSRMKTAMTDLPFAHCTNVEIGQFFVHRDTKDQELGMIWDRCYDTRTSHLDLGDTQSQMDWSILTPVPSYTSHPSPVRGLHVHRSGSTKRNRRPPPTVAYPAPRSIKRLFYDRFEGVKSHLNTSDFFNEVSEVGTTYLGNPKVTPNSPFHLEYSFPMSCFGFAVGYLSSGQEVECLIDTGAMRSIMTKAFFMACPILSKAPRFKPYHDAAIVGNGNRVKVLFTVPVIISFGAHTFEIYAQVTDTVTYELFVIGLKTLSEIEAVIDTRNNEVLFLNRSAPMFPLENVTIPPKEKKQIALYLQFPTHLTGMIVIKMTRYCPSVVTAKIAVSKNTCNIEVFNTDNSPLEVSKDTVIGYADARSLGFFHVSNNKLKDQLGKHYGFAPIHCFQESMNFLSAQISDSFKPRTKNGKTDPYPWLDPEDPRRHMSDEEILDKTIDLSKSSLTKSEKKKLMAIVHKNKAAFSLRDEIGECPNLRVTIDVVDDSPFFVRPFPIAEDDKPIMDKQMNRLVELGILTRTSTSHTSPVMLITRKITRDKRPIVDFRLLNTRIRRRNNANPLLKDIFKMLGKSRCEVLSCVDIKDAYHSIRLDEKSKEFCGILPYFGSQHYRYEVLPMGLGTSPAIWMTYVNFLLDSIPNRDKIIAIMDDLLLHSTRKIHMQLLTDLFETMIKNGLKLSPKKSQLFVKELVYLGTLFTIRNDEMVITPLLTRVDAIKNIPSPTTPKGCKSFCGVVNYLAIFCPDLQKLLKPIYELTKKTVKYVWTEEHQTNFDEIKKRLCEFPVLHLPTPTGRFILYSDTSRRHAGSAMWQMQKGTPRLIGYASKTLPKACLNYSVTELEMFGLSINLHLWNHLIASVDFDCATDHLAAVQIMNGKDEPKGRLKTILPKIFQYTFRLYYVKGKDLILADYFSRIPADQRRAEEVIPISFLNLMQPDYGQFCPMTTRRRATAGGVVVPKVHGVDKQLDPHVKPEHQKQVRQSAPVPNPTVHHEVETRYVEKQMPHRKVVKPKPAPKAEVQRKHPHPTAHARPGVPRKRQFGTTQQQVDHIVPQTAHVPPFMRPTPVQFKPKTVAEIDAAQYDPLMDTDSPFDDALVEIEYRRPDNNDFKIPPSLEKQIEQGRLARDDLPKQIDIDRVMRRINRKVLRQTHLPLTLRDLQAAYLESPQLRDIYVYLSQNKCPKSRKSAKSVVRMAQDYMLLDGLLFKITYDKLRDEPSSVLCIPTSKVDMLLDSYHSSLLGGHAGITKCYMTICQRFYCPNLSNHIRAYITGCHVCQLLKAGPRFDRPHHKRININVPALTKISMDIKHMPPAPSPSGEPYKFLLVLLCEVSNFVVLAPMKTTTTPEICMAIKHEFIAKYGPPECIVCDQDPAFTSNLMTYFVQQLGIRLYTVSVHNHKSLLAEHGIKSLSSIIKYLMFQAEGPWINFVDEAMASYNSYASPNLDGLCPYELVYGRKPKIIPNMEIKVSAPAPGTYRTYLRNLQKQLTVLRKHLQEFRDKRHDILNKDKELHGFTVGQIVYLYLPSGAVMQTGSRKIRCKFVGPLVIYKAISPNQFLIMSLVGEVYPRLIEESRMKPGVIRTTKGNVKTLSELKAVLRSGYKLRFSTVQSPPIPQL